MAKVEGSGGAVERADEGAGASGLMGPHAAHLAGRLRDCASRAAAPADRDLLNEAATAIDWAAMAVEVLNGALAARNRREAAFAPPSFEAPCEDPRCVRNGGRLEHSIVDLEGAPRSVIHGLRVATTRERVNAAEQCGCEACREWLGAAPSPTRAPFSGALNRVFGAVEERLRSVTKERDTMLATLTAAQESGTRLALESQAMRAVLADVERSADKLRAFVGRVDSGSSSVRSEIEAALDAVLAITGACQAVKR